MKPYGGIKTFRLDYGGHMYSLCLQNEDIYFLDIKPGHLPQILDWYNKVDDFKYATGIESPITLQELTRKYAEVAICSNEFFVGIYTKQEKNMVGILKGALKFKKRDAMWISSIVVDIKYQKRGYGRAAIELLLNYLNREKGVKSVYLAVVEDNIQGRLFWSKLGFESIKKMEKHQKFRKETQNVLIMGKKL